MASFLAATIFGVVDANQQVDHYQKDLSVWQKQTQQFVAQLKANIFSDKMVIGSTENDAQLSALEIVCSANHAYETRLQKNLSPPELSGNVFGFFSGSYRQAQASQTHTDQQFDTIKVSLMSQLSSYDTFCNYYDEGVRVGQLYDSLVAKRDQHMSPPGSSTTIQSGTTYTTYSCGADDWCLSEDKSTWPIVAGISQQLEDEYYKAFLNYVQAQPCFFAAYQKVCGVERAYYTTYSQTYQLYVNAIKTQNDGEVIKQNAAIHKISNDYGTKYSDAYKQVNPGIDTSNDSYASIAWQDQQKIIEHTIASDATKLAQLP